MRTRVGHRVERAFHHWQQGQFGRHAARFQFLNNVVQIGPAAFDHAAQGIGVVLVPLLMIEGEVIVQIGHRKTVADTIPQVVGRGGEVDAARRLQGGTYFMNGQRIFRAGLGGITQRAGGEQGNQGKTVGNIGDGCGGQGEHHGSKPGTSNTADQRQNVAVLHRGGLLARTGSTKRGIIPEVSDEIRFAEDSRNVEMAT